MRNDTDYDEKKFDKDEYGNLIPRETKRRTYIGCIEETMNEPEYIPEEDN